MLKIQMNQYVVSQTIVNSMRIHCYFLVMYVYFISIYFSGKHIFNIVLTVILIEKDMMMSDEVLLMKS